MGANPPLSRVKSWTSAWQKEFSDIPSILSGEQAGLQFPDADSRQHRLISLAIDAAILTGVFEALKAGKMPDRLLTFSESQHRDLITPATVKLQVKQIKSQKGTQSEKDQALMKLTLALRDHGLIRNHRMLIPDKSWDAYQEDRHMANLIWEDYHHRHREWQDDGAIGKEPSRPPVDPNPDDPRRLACNELVGPVIQLPASRIKTMESIGRKLRDRQMSEGGFRTLTDINAIMVVPDKPETAAIFETFLQELHPAKKISGHEVPRVQSVAWEVKNHCHFDKKIYVALDRLANGQLSPGVSGMVGEIKIVGARMAEADALTAPVNDALKDLRDTRKFFPDNNAAKTITDFERQKTQAILERSRERFEAVCQRQFGDQKPPYCFPALPQDGKPWSRDQTYSTLQLQLLNLNRAIYIDALNSEAQDLKGKDGAPDRCWQEAFLRTAYLQQIRGEPQRRPVKERSGMTDRDLSKSAIEEGVLLRIGPPDSEWRRRLRQQAKAEYRQETENQRTSSRA